MDEYGMETLGEMVAKDRLKRIKEVKDDILSDWINNGRLIESIATVLVDQFEMKRK